MWTETLHSCLHSNIKVHSLPDAVSSFLCIQAMNVMLASWHTGQPTFLSLCLVYMWQGHNRVPDNRPLIEWLAGSGIHPRSSVTLQPRAPYGSWSVSGCTLLWRRGEGAAMLEIWERSQRSGWFKKKKIEGRVFTCQLYQFIKQYIDLWWIVFWLILCHVKGTD